MQSNIAIAFTLMATVSATPAVLEARDQFGCMSFGDRVSKACCSTSYGLGGQYRYYDSWLDLIQGLTKASFDNGRGNRAPRSTCDYGSGMGGVCVSWADYTSSYLDQDLIDVIKNFSGECAYRNASTQFYVRWNDGSSGSVCVSSTPDGCGPHF